MEAAPCQPFRVDFNLCQGFLQKTFKSGERLMWWELKFVNVIFLQMSLIHLLSYAVVFAEDVASEEF